MFRTPEEIRRMTVGENETLKAAVRRLDEEGFGIVLVIGENGKLRGIVTNGDFRRCILAGGSLEDKVTAAMNPTAVTVIDGPGSPAGLARCFQSEGIRYVPILDDDGTVLDVVFVDEIENHQAPENRAKNGLQCDVVIMAGGKGTRLDPFTRVLPKPLIPIGDRPILEIIMNRFAERGVSRFHVSLNHMGKMIRAYLEESAGAFDISYLEEEHPLGTAGALSLLAGRMTHPFFVTNCDVIILANYSSIFRTHLEKGHALTVVGSVHQHTIPYGVCEIGRQGGLNRIIEKPMHEVLVNTGMYVLSPESLERIPAAQHFDMTDLISSLLEAGESVGVYPVSEHAWLDVGQWQEYRRAVQKLEEHDEVLPGPWDKRDEG